MSKKRAIAETLGFLSRLRRDVRGNTLALMAAMLIPLAALSGSAVDLGRTYSVKTRLQQACDAGVLAGRKMMTDTSGTTLDADATAAAQTFFSNNFKTGWFRTTGLTFTPSKTGDSQVSGTASVSVPMTVMTMFGMSARTVSVTCEARYDVADADIMFVLDTTGSMACTTSDDPCNAPVKTYTRSDGTTAYYTVEESGSKIGGLRTAVLSFYDTLAATADSTTHIRYGFVTYTSTVNVGYLLPQADLVKTWNYQSRKWTGNDVNNGNTTTQTYSNVATSADCTAKLGRQPATGYDGSGQAQNNISVNSYTGSTQKCVIKVQPLLPEYKYDQYSLDVSQFITGASVTDPTRVVPSTSKWQGCIEERDTTTGSTFNTDSLPADLDPDLVPTSDATRWRPMWEDAEYYRPSTSSSTHGGDVVSGSSVANYSSYGISGGNQQTAYYTCGKPAQRLATMTRDDVSNYVNASDFKVIGGTYHDTGMIWGTRLISPNGIFASDTAAWPGRQAPNRFIVFMTDGQMNTNPNIYGLYGMEALDKRASGSSPSKDTANHNARFLAECAAAKARNITVFVVGFGQTLNSQLKTCASPGQAYYASDNAALKTAFQKIAQQVAMLRISK